MIQVTVNVVPMGAVRMTNRGKFVKPAAQRYLSYKDEIGWTVRKACETPLRGPLRVDMAFYYPVPESWPQKKRKEALEGRLLPEIKPDLDNVIKGVFDAANGILWHDDKQIVQESSSKQYGEQPRIEITVSPISG